MIISTLAEVHEEELKDEEQEMYLHTPLNSVRAALGFENFSSSLIRKVSSSSRDLSMRKRLSSGLNIIDEDS